MTEQQGKTKGTSDGQKRSSQRERTEEERREEEGDIGKAQRQPAGREIDGGQPVKTEG